jgi:hypothetical protein
MGFATGLTPVLMTEVFSIKVQQLAHGVSYINGAKVIVQVREQRLRAYLG